MFINRGMTLGTGIIGTSGALRRRAELLSSEEIDSRTGTFTVPTGCNLVFVGIGSRHNATSATLNSQTLNGNAMTVARAWAQNTNRTGAGIYYYANPTIGAQTCTFTFSANPASAMMTAWYFDGDPANPLGIAGSNSSTGANNLSVTMDPVTALPVILAMAVHTHSSGTGDGSWTGTNLTVDNQFGVASNTSYGSGYNNTLEDPGSTAFNLANLGWGNSYFSIAACEVRMVG